MSWSKLSVLRATSLTLFRLYQYCFRICKDASDAWLWCQHIYDILVCVVRAILARALQVADDCEFHQGCQWNQPGDFGSGFDTCQGDSVSIWQKTTWLGCSSSS